MSSRRDEKDSSDEESFPEALRGVGPTTILAYGSLLSEVSARVTFPHLSNFRLVRVRGFRRVFAHPHMFLLRRNITDLSDPSLRLASLSVEKVVSSNPTSSAEESSEGFVAAAFEVELDDTQRAAFVERERAYRIVSVPYYNIDSDSVALPAGVGVICLAGTDDQLPQELAPVVARLKECGRSVWHWERNSGLYPSDLYLRHCILAVKKAGSIAEKSFLEETFLADRTTSLAEYIAKDGNEERVLAARPPADLMTRFNG